jgi:hypothetical protein
LLLFTIGPRDVSIVQSLYKAGIKVRHTPFERGADIGEWTS